MQTINMQVSEIKASFLPFSNDLLLHIDVQVRPPYHGPGIAVAFVDHFDRGSPDILSLALLHLPPLFSPAEQLLDASGCRAPETQKTNNFVRKSFKKNDCFPDVRKMATSPRRLPARALWVIDCPAVIKASLLKENNQYFMHSFVPPPFICPVCKTLLCTPSVLAMHVSRSTG